MGGGGALGAVRGVRQLVVRASMHHMLAGWRRRPMAGRGGDWRVVSVIEDGRLVVLMVRISPRGGMYGYGLVTASTLPTAVELSLLAGFAASYDLELV